MSGEGEVHIHKPFTVIESDSVDVVTKDLKQ